MEDEIDIQGFLQRSLDEAGYEFEVAPDARTAVQLAFASSRSRAAGPGWNQPEPSIARTGNKRPVLILSARRSVDDRVRGLEQGGYDYLTKPRIQGSGWKVKRSNHSKP